jgi:hypothetical protein
MIHLGIRQLGDHHRRLSCRLSCPTGNGRINMRPVATRLSPLQFIRRF